MQCSACKLGTDQKAASPIPVKIKNSCYMDVHAKKNDLNIFVLPDTVGIHIPSWWTAGKRSNILRSHCSNLLGHMLKPTLFILTIVKMKQGYINITSLWTLLLYFQRSARKFSSDWGDLAQQGIDLALTVATPKKTLCTQA